MNKDVNIKVIYQGKSELFQCPRSRFLNDVAKRYKVNPKTCDVFTIEKNSRKKVLVPADLKDLSVVEIVPKGATQRDLHSFYGGESSKQESCVEKIITKLKNNTFLSGQERKYLIEVLENNSSSSTLGKRKREDDVNGYERPKTLNKKIQAQPTTQFHKESCTQTDLVFESLNENSNEVEDVVSQMKRLAASGSQNQEEIKALMQLSYKDRRNFILFQSPLVVIIKEQYPLLFSVEEVKNELERMFYVGKCDDFMNNIDKYSNIILNSCDRSNLILQRTLKSLEMCHTEKQKKYAKAVGSVLVIPSLIDETICFLNTSDNDGKNDNYPYIDASLHTLKSVFYDNMLFKLMTERNLVCEASNFKEAILCLVACYFIFNIDYPKDCENTLVIFEKLYLRANDTHDIDPKVEQLIRLFELKANS